MTDRPIEQQVLYRVERGVAWIVLNRPEAGNALTPTQRNHIIALLERVKSDDEARQEFVDLLETMGPDDPRTARYRKALTARLF